MDIKQEDLIKLWTWCGFKKDGIGIWHCPNKIDEVGKATPKADLTNLFQYAIPKLQEKNYHLYFNAYPEKGFYVAIELIYKDAKWYQNKWEPIVEFDTEEPHNPTEALYKAIMQVIEKEAK